MRDLVDLKLDTPIATEEELEKLEKVEFLNKNQETMITKKIQEAIEKRQGELEKRAVLKNKFEKESNTRKVRSKAERNRAKTRESDNQISEFTAEEKLKKQLKQGKLTKEDYDSKLDKIDRKHEYKVDPTKKKLTK